MDEPVSLAAKRAEKKADCREWTARDAVVELLRQIDAGEACPTQIAIHWTEEKADGGKRNFHFLAGLTHPGHIALLATAQHIAIQDWLV